MVSTDKLTPGEQCYVACDVFKSSIMDSGRQEPTQVSMSGSERTACRKPVLGFYEVNINTEITNCGVGNDSIICSSSVS
ncbi:hypothetical protein P7L66_22440 [Tistrella mobilis]|uniref:hypothetical protein n=1 Tax=Tistrella mobilis TaxID=171437 RepID=UPI003558C6FB